MQVPASHAVARMGAETDLHQRIAGLAAHYRARIALPFQPDDLSVLDVGRQLHGKLAAVGKDCRDPLRRRDILNRNVERDVQILPGRRTASGRTTTALLRKGLPENLAEQVVPADGRATACATRAGSTGTTATEFPAHAAGATALAAPKTAERPAGPGLEALKFRLALGVDLTAIERATRLLVTENLVSLIESGKPLLRLRIILILVGMMLLREFAEGCLDVLGLGCPGDAQHLIRVAHCSLDLRPKPLMKSPVVCCRTSRKKFQSRRWPDG